MSLDEVCKSAGSFDQPSTYGHRCCLRYSLLPSVSLGIHIYLNKASLANLHLHSLH
jgi:hypothetical protein